MGIPIDFCIIRALTPAVRPVRKMWSENVAHAHP